ncbi:MAG: DUF4159 domain-containing protein [Planctomycetota bacterium]|nr:DUF4159 domain-containing protein [Planctomycetota bacterium]
MNMHNSSGIFRRVHATCHQAWPLALLLGTLCLPALSAQSFTDLFPPAKDKKVKKAEKKQGEEELFREETEEEKLVDAFTMRHIRFGSDWNPDPTALPQFTYQFRKALRMRCKMIDEPLELSDPEIFKWPFLWMHAHNSFRFTKAERENLIKYLNRGGVLIADDCSAGGAGWLPSLRAEVGKMYAGKGWEVVTPDHKRFNRLFKISYKYRTTIKTISSLHNEVFLLDDRIAIFLIHDDYGCQWEVSSPPTSANPLGNGMHGFTSEERKRCFEFSFNIMLYLLTH